MKHFAFTKGVINNTTNPIFRITRLTPPHGCATFTGCFAKTYEILCLISLDLVGHWDAPLSMSRFSSFYLSLDVPWGAIPDYISYPCIL